MKITKLFSILAALFLIVIAGCSGEETPSRVPADFLFVMDVRSTESETSDSLNINIRVNADGSGRYEYYDTQGVIQYDTAGVIRYDKEQVVETGRFELTDEELTRLWDVVNTNRFFELEENYQMALGHSYAFIMVQANGRQHKVDNIGMEVAEIRAMVESAREILPAQIQFEYGEGFQP